MVALWMQNGAFAAKKVPHFEQGYNNQINYNNNK